MAHGGAGSAGGEWVSGPTWPSRALAEAKQAMVAAAVGGDGGSPGKAFPKATRLESMHGGGGTTSHGQTRGRQAVAKRGGGRRRGGGTGAVPAATGARRMRRRFQLSRLLAPGC